MNEEEKKLVQEEIERVYALFKKRVAEGRKRDTAYVDSIAQGRVWTGHRAIQIGLVDRFGGLKEAVASAARMAGLKEYHVREYPETENFLKELLGKSGTPMNYTQKIKEEMGEEGYKLYQQMKRVREMTNTMQARLPFEFYIR